MNDAVARECTMLSDEEKITFPEVVRRLAEADIELYYADLLASNKTYYANNNALTIACSSKSKRKVADIFNPEGIIRAIQKIQSGQIKYQEFLKNIMDSGVISYMVLLKAARRSTLENKVSNM